MKKGKWLCARDEDDEEDDGVDQLAEGEEEEQRFVRPVLNPEDPFGDEDEV